MNARLDVCPILVSQELIRLEFDGDKVVHEERLPGDQQNLLEHCIKKILSLGHVAERAALSGAPA
ncbi:hypothetical protein [Pseudomonas sp. NFX15]|uniref:hypothetical protein n=1 Tax=Pseudomonas sp. NFX15 TaxID=2816958 RepID=UPI003B8B462D